MHSVLALMTSSCMAVHSSSVVDVAIIGGGPCGLATALALSKARCLRGAAVEVFESDAFGPKGASIGLSETGWAALAGIDAEAAQRVRATGAPITRFSFRAMSGDSLQLQDQLPAADGLSRIYLWHAVREVLRGRVEEHGVALLRPSKTLVQMTEEEECVRLRFDDGEEVAARVVLACDGARSACRRLLPSEPNDLLLDEGKSVWRGQAPGLDVGGVATTFKDDGGRTGLVMPAGIGQGSSWTVISDSVAGRSQSSEEARARLAAALPNTLDATLRQAIDASPLIIESKLQTRDFSKPWASAAPRVAFLGDAAHPLRPTGEGTALALEDAWTIGRLAAEAATADAFCDPATLRQYEGSRRARVEAVSNAVRLVATRGYQKGAKGNANLGNKDTILGAYEAHPIVCTPL